MRRARSVSLLLAQSATVAIASLALIASVAVAQTMGEYGTTVSHTATTSSAMPDIVSQPLTSQPSAAVNSSTHTEEEVRTYDAPATGDTSEDKDPPSGKPSRDDWTQVK
jgi:hypothetical protein